MCKEYLSPLDRRVKYNLPIVLPRFHFFFPLFLFIIPYPFWREIWLCELICWGMLFVCNHLSSKHGVLYTRFFMTVSRPLARSLYDKSAFQLSTAASLCWISKLKILQASSQTDSYLQWRYCFISSFFFSLLICLPFSTQSYSDKTTFPLSNPLLTYLNKNFIDLDLLHHSLLIWLWNHLKRYLL